MNYIIKADGGKVRDNIFHNFISLGIPLISAEITLERWLALYNGDGFRDVMIASNDWNTTPIMYGCNQIGNPRLMQTTVTRYVTYQEAFDILFPDMPKRYLKNKTLYKIP